MQRISEELQVEEGSLYPSRIKRSVTAKWNPTAGNRRTGYCQLTAAGRKQLLVATSPFERVAGAITRVIRAV
jgi:hypothetical protein